ncbi:hypothetical protein GOODEAATRI_007009 [Goodea atripinnis]|uniref:Uncharacterized protein n=1 Tax=Goodea atripinnis TaxID=208336 RepID=A0ABV0MFR2_9TELE
MPPRYQFPSSWLKLCKSLCKHCSNLSSCFLLLSGHVDHNFGFTTFTFGLKNHGTQLPAASASSNYPPACPLSNFTGSTPSDPPDRCLRIVPQEPPVSIIYLEITSPRVWTRRPENASFGRIKRTVFPLEIIKLLKLTCVLE